MIENWVSAVKEQTYGQLLFILVAGLVVTVAVFGFVFLVTRKARA